MFDDLRQIDFAQFKFDDAFPEALEETSPLLPFKGRRRDEG